MTVSRQQVLQAVRELCPPRFALEGDRTGLQVGREDGQVARVLCTLDLTLEVAEEARDLGCGLVISHHAVIFRPLADLRTDRFKGRILQLLLQHDVAVYVPHTALDVVPGGLNDWLAERLELRDCAPLEGTGRDEAALLLLDGGADPAALARKAEEAGALAVSVRAGALEVVAPRARAERLGEKLVRAGGGSARIVPLLSHATPRGIGRVGRLPNPEPLGALAARLKPLLGAPGVRVAAVDLNQPVEKVAVLGGDGRRFLDAAAFAGAQVLITGDVDHHTALEARARGLALIDVGHWASERQVSELLVEGLRQRLAGLPVEVLASQVDTNPFAFV